MKRAALSTWPSVSSPGKSSAGASSQTTRVTPSASCNSRSASSRVDGPPRERLSKHCGVVSSVPRPSVSSAPPSSTTSYRSHPSPSAPASRPANASSSSNGSYFPPQALNRKSFTRSSGVPPPPGVSHTNSGPESRTHESFVAIPSSPGVRTVTTSPIVSHHARCCSCAASRHPGHVSGLCGGTTHTAPSGSHSAGNLMSGFRLLGAGGMAERE